MLWVVVAVGLGWGMSRSWGLAVVGLDVPVLGGSPLAVCALMGLLLTFWFAGLRFLPVVALVWSGFSWQSLLWPCRVESCSGAASGRCTWLDSDTVLMRLGKSRPSVWFPGL